MAIAAARSRGATLRAVMLDRLGPMSGTIPSPRPARAGRTGRDRAPVAHHPRPGRALSEAQIDELNSAFGARCDHAALCRQPVDDVYPSTPSSTALPRPQPMASTRSSSFSPTTMRRPRSPAAWPTRVCSKCCSTPRPATLPAASAASLPGRAARRVPPRHPGARPALCPGAALPAPARDGRADARPAVKRAELRAVYADNWPGPRVKPPRPVSTC